MRSPLLALALTGCIAPAAYPCEQDSQCDAKPVGKCASGFCSYEDAECPSGFRFEARAPGTLASACVPVESGSSSTGEPTVPASSGSSESGGATQPPACGGAGEPCCEDGGPLCEGTMGCYGHGCGCVTNVLAGSLHTCASYSNGSLACWGGNADQALGRDDEAGFSPDPEPVDDFPAPTQVFEGGATGHTCVIGGSGQVLCWGANSSGQAYPDSAPTPVPTATTVLMPRELGLSWEPSTVATGGEHTCAADPGHVLCWGNNDAGQLGIPDEFGEVDASQLDGEIGGISAGLAHTCVRTDPVGGEGASAQMYCWGWDGLGQLGNGGGDETSWLAQRVALPKTEAILEIEAGDAHTCALVGSPDPTADREVWCWGGNATGAAGGELATAVDTPRPVPGLPVAPWVQISASAEHTCALQEGGAWCWGANDGGRVAPHLAPGVLGPTRVPVEQQLGLVLFSIAAGLVHTCGIASDGSVRCWGCGFRGQLGPDVPTFCDDAGGIWGSVLLGCE